MMERQQIKQIFGIVCVVEDLKEATENWRTMVEFDPGSVRTGKSAENVKHIYRGKEIMCRYKYMDFDMGGVRVRLIEPENKSGGDPYSDALSKRGPGFHHLMVYPENREELIERYDEEGIKPSLIEESGEDVYLIYDFEQDTGLCVALHEEITGPCARV